jgi:hypothetical protein
MRRGVGVGAPSLQLELLTVSNDEGRFAFMELPAGRFMLAASNPYGRWRTLWAEDAARFDENVFLTGAWILTDERPQSRDLEAFLEGGLPPLYFGFGSTRAPQDAGRVMLEAVRAVGGGRSCRALFWLRMRRVFPAMPARSPAHFRRRVYRSGVLISRRDTQR